MKCSKKIRSIHFSLFFTFIFYAVLFCCSELFFLNHKKVTSNDLNETHEIKIHLIKENIIQKTETPEIIEKKLITKQITEKKIDPQITKSDSMQKTEEVANNTNLNPVKNQTFANLNFSKNDFLELLDKKIKENLVYPSGAKKRGIQGTVVLILSIDSNGFLKSCSISKSSGSSVLDKEAQNLIKTIFLSDFEKHPNAEINTEVAINYKMM